MTRDRFFLAFSSLFLFVVWIGFSRSFYLRELFGFPEIPVHLRIHGIALTAWFVLACLQPWLIRYGSVRWHRRLGIAGVAVALGAVGTGIWTLVMRDAPVIDESPGQAAGNLASLIMFLSCFTLGVMYRRNPAAHKRLMVMASIPVLAPALDRVARIPSMYGFWSQVLAWFPAPPEVAFATLGFLGLLLLVAVHDVVVDRRVHKGTTMGLVAIFVFTPIATFAIIGSGAWASLVKWLA